MKTSCFLKYSPWLISLLSFVGLGCQKSVENHLDRYPYGQELVRYLEEVHQLDLEYEVWVALVPIPNCSGCTEDALKICIDNPSIRPVILNRKNKDMLPYKKLLDQLPHMKRDSLDHYFDYDTGIYDATMVLINDRKLSFYREVDKTNSAEISQYIRSTLE